MRRRAALAACLFSLLGQAKEPATLSELEVLLQKSAYAELLERAEDLAPAARTDAWKNLVAGAAAGVINSAAVTQDPFASALQADALMKRHTFLGERKPFLEARDGAVLNGARRCFVENDGERCWKTLAAFEPTLTPAGGLELAKALRKNGALPGRVTALYARAAAKDPAACKDADVQDVLVASLDGPAEGAPAVAARSVAFTTCYAALSPKLKAAMVGASKYLLQNACKPLREKKALTAMQEDLCQDEGQ